MKPIIPLVPVKLTQEEREQIAKKLLNMTPQAPLPSSGITGELEEIAENNGSTKTQDNWITYFNQVKKIMLSSYDLYNAGKNSSDNLIKSLREDFKESWIMTSTRIKYQPTSLDAKIIHYYNSSITKQEENSLKIPVYNNEFIENVLNTNEGLMFLQTLFNTQDNKETIMQTLENLSGYTRNKTKISTPDEQGRKNYPERLAGFLYADVDFLVDCGALPGGDGRSRRVLKTPR